jgi:hypothetical protein
MNKTVEERMQDMLVIHGLLKGIFKTLHSIQKNLGSIA